MLGKHNSVLSQVQDKIDGQVFDLWCICHIVNLCVGAVVKNLGLPVNDLLIDIFYFFNISCCAIAILQVNVIYYIIVIECDNLLPA